MSCCCWIAGCIARKTRSGGGAIQGAILFSTFRVSPAARIVGTAIVVAATLNAPTRAAAAHTAPIGTFVAYTSTIYTTAIVAHLSQWAQRQGSSNLVGFLLA